MAGVLLKRLIKDEWEESMADEEKQHLKAKLPLGLVDAERKVTTMVGMTIGQISAFDYPDEWPTLVEDLLMMVQTHAGSHPAAVYGCVTCLEVVTEKAADDSLAKLTAILAPAMLQMLSSDVFPVNVKRRSMRTLYRIFELAAFVPARKNVVVKQLPALLPLLVQQAFLPFTVPNAFLMAEALPILAIVLQHWAKHAVDMTLDIALRLLQRLSSSCPEFLRREVAQNSQASWEEGYTSDGDVVSEATLIAQDLEVLSVLLQCSKLQDRIAVALRPQAGCLIRCLLNYTKITNDMLSGWEEDINEFVTQDECAEEGYSRMDCLFGSTASIRDLALICIEALCQIFDDEGMTLVFSGMQDLSTEALHLRDSGEGHSWKSREVALRVLALLCGTMGESLKKVVDFQALLDSIVSCELLDPMTQPLLRARAIFAIGSVFKLHTPRPEFAQMVFQQIVGTMSTATLPATVHVACCKVLPTLRPHVPAEVIAGHLRTIIHSLCRLLGIVQEETLTLVLATLTMLLRHHPETDLLSLPADVLQLWAKHKNDPLAAQSIVELYTAICKNRHPSTAPQLENCVLPALLSLLANHHFFPGLAEAAVEVVTEVIKYGQETTATTAIRLGLGPVAALLLSSEDHTIAQNGCVCLRAMVWRAGTHICSCQVEVPGEGICNALELVLRVLQTLFQRDYGETQLALNFVGGLLGQVLKDLGSHLSSNVINGLLQATLVKLSQVEGKNSYLTQSLIMVFARMILHQNTATVEFLQSCYVEEKCGVTILLKLWLDQQLDFFGHVDRAT
eukprot:EG_transcript_3840